MLAYRMLKINQFFFILMDAKHFKIESSLNKIFTSFTPLLSTVSKLYYTYYHLRLLKKVCIVPREVLKKLKKLAFDQRGGGWCQNQTC